MITRANAIADLMSSRPLWASNIVLAGIRGSDAHGTKLPEEHAFHTDDIDTFGVSVATEEWYLGLRGYSTPARKLSWDTSGEHYDHLIHDVRKLFSLAAQGNPNVLCWLFSDPEDLRVVESAGLTILESRRAFLSKKCFVALAGYATAQLKKMERTKYAGYMGEKRKALVDKVGYDVKHAAHCIRLLRMGCELAETGMFHTRRPAAEAKFLMEVKAGSLSYEEVRSYATGIKERFRLLEGKSTLPDEPDRDHLNDILLRVIREANKA